MFQERRHVPAPIPGTVPPPRGLFVDRWGTLLEGSGDVLPAFSSGLVRRDTLDLLFRVSRGGWRVYLIGNEDAVAHGRSSDEAWKAFESALLAHLRAHGIVVHRSYACIDDPDHGCGAHRKDSVFRLPDTGIFFHAAQTDGVSLRQSYVIGDSTLEIGAGSRAGCRTISVRTGAACGDRSLAVDADVQTESLAEALSLMLESESFAA
jgi:mannose-1-phosphate guanylyltransferase / phosphomannomutase